MEELDHVGLRRYAARKKRNGKSVFAAALDRILLSIACAFLLYAWLRLERLSELYCLIMACLTALLVLSALCLFARTQTTRTCRMILKYWKQRYETESLLFLDKDSFSDLVYDALALTKNAEILQDGCVRHENKTYHLRLLQRPPQCPVTADILLEEYKRCSCENVLIVCTAPLHKQAYTLLPHMPTLQFLCTEQLQLPERQAPDTDTLLSLYAERPPEGGRRLALLSKVSAAQGRRFARSGLLLIVLSFFTWYKTLYLAVGGLLLLLAFGAAWRGASSKTIEGLSSDGR